MGRNGDQEVFLEEVLSKISSKGVHSIKWVGMDRKRGMEAVLPQVPSLSQCLALRRSVRGDLSPPSLPLNIPAQRQRLGP